MTIRYQAFCLEFPQELSDYIFETPGLRDDYSSLKHCSLVCRAWLYATRTHLFRHVILTSKNVVPFTFLITDSPSTVHSHIKKLELRKIDCLNLNRRVISNFTSTLTHLLLRDMSFNSFIDILDIICLFPCLQSIALEGLTVVETSSVEKSPRIHNKVLPSSVNSVRYRGEFLRTFLLWLLRHTNVPKITDLDVGPIQQECIFEVGRFLVFNGRVVKHISFTFAFSDDTHICFQDNYTEALLTTEHTNASSIARRYKALFGLEICPNLAALTGLQSLRLDNFIHFEDRNQDSALFWAPRLLASIKAVELHEVILCVSLGKAGELDKFNIRWDFLDEMFNSMDGPYANLVSLKFEITGTVKMDGIASLIRSRLPGCEKRGLLQFCRKN